MSSDLASQLARQLQAREAEVRALRALLGDIHTALIAAGWRDDELVQRVKAMRAAGPAPKGGRP